MDDFPHPITPRDHVEPVPRRIRAVLGGQVVADTTRALYVWEHEYYPHFYIPADDVDAAFLVDEERPQRLHRGNTRLYTLRAGELERPGAARLLVDDDKGQLAGTFRIEWGAIDAWFEEDEEVFVHPRNPYVRVDALRSRRHVRVELDGTVLADSAAPVAVFETGLPTRYYLDRTDVDFDHLVATATETACPYKGRTSGYWSARLGTALTEDVAWVYDFPTHAVAPIAGMLAFYNEKVDIVLDGRLLPRPSTRLVR